MAVTLIRSREFGVKRLVDLELLVAEDRYALPAFLDSVHLHLWAPHHEVGVRGRLVEALRAVLFVDSECETASECDVAGRVLVEKRAEEGDPELADLG